MTDIGEQVDLLPEARAALARGWSILPNYGRPDDEQSYKRPGVAWQTYSDRRPEVAEINQWFGSGHATGMFIVCGPVSGVVVLDIDDEQAEQWWRALVGGAMEQTRQVRTGSGKRHYWFLHPTEPMRSASRNAKAAPSPTGSWDLRARGSGVVVPPSLHPSGGRYEWLNDLELQTWPLTDQQLQQAVEVAESGNGHKPITRAKGVKGSGSSGGGRSTLAWLLENPGVGGRNIWVTQVAGHLAKRWPWFDAYQSQMERMVWPLVSSLPGDHEYTHREFVATARSVWQAERSSSELRPLAEFGWLRGDGQQLWTERKVGDTDRLEPTAWSNFDLHTSARLRDPDGTWLYQLQIRRQPNEMGEDAEIEESTALLPAETLGSTDRFARWLAARRLVLYTPRNDYHAAMKSAGRVQMYLDAQGAPEHEIAPWMGWCDLAEDSPIRKAGGAEGLYVCSEGVIDHAGIVTDAPLVVDPRKDEAGGVAWTYGRAGDPLSAAADLATILSFHDPVVTSLFGAIWALAPIKGLLMQAGSIFPQVAIVAPSESGKTNGYFELMLQANGRRQPGGLYTAASLRDDLSRHRGGFVWIDDPSNIEDLGELLRAAASEGMYTRRSGQNWDRQLRLRLVAPTVVAAEGLAVLAERAMADRFVRLDVPSPTSRRSLIDGRTGPQWDDILEFARGVGGLWNQAGWYVQAAMCAVEDIRRQAGTTSAADAVSRLLQELRPTGMSGRLAERQAMIRLGARMLAAMARGDLAETSGTDWWSNCTPVEIPDARQGDRWLGVVELVDDWIVGEVVQEEKGERTGPYVAEVILPTWLSSMGYLPRYGQAPATAVFVGMDGMVHFHQGSLASWWSIEANKRGFGARGQMMGSAEAMLTEVRRAEWTTVPVKGKRYMRCDPQTSARILDRAGFSTWVDGTATIEDAEALRRSLLDP